MTSMLKAALEAAMTTVPRLLMAAWTTMLDRANTALCTPAGSPMRRMRSSIFPSIRSCRGSSRMTLSVRRSRRQRSAALTALEITVAMATPLTVMCSTATKKRLRATLSTPVVASAARGIRVSPTLRKMAASKLYRRMTGIPAR